jgi:hypothetical protein
MAIRRMTNPRRAAAESDPIHGFVLDLGYQMIAKTLNTLIYEDGSAAAVDKEAS